MKESISINEGEIFPRSLIHNLYGGNRQSGISASSQYPFIFIFSGIEGQKYGYEDQWENPYVYSYCGEGQKGDMLFKKGNLALRDHIKNGKRVYLFEKVSRKNGLVKYICELEFLDADFFIITNEVLPRVGIKFFFKKANKYDYIPIELKNNSLIFQNPTIDYVKLVNTPNKTEREGLVTSRVGQGAFRKSLMHFWEYKCAVTKISKVEILIASHIKSWAQSNEQERLDVHNGILLSPNLDALFDKNYISFENSGKIILSKELTNSNYQKLGIIGNEKIEIKSNEIIKYLDYHRNNK